MPDCPQCGSNRTYKSTDDPEDKSYKCKQCSAWFEPEDDAGDYHTDPTRRIQREEENARRRREKRRS
jgi:DNA-directed RNA polymerase subunit RPC12/RpoP